MYSLVARRLVNEDSVVEGSPHEFSDVASLYADNGIITSQTFNKILILRIKTNMVYINSNA
jgi:hypothetical protein